MKNRFTESELTAITAAIPGARRIGPDTWGIQDPDNEGVTLVLKLSKTDLPVEFMAADFRFTQEVYHEMGVEL